MDAPSRFEWPLVAPSLLAVALACSGACQPATSPAPQARAEATPAAPPQAPVKAGPRFVEHPNGESLQAKVAAARSRSLAADRQFMVYVGAKWCEPCRYFHDAVLAGELDDAFPKLDLMEFDLDAEKAELTAAGYQSRLIPLFATTNADGSAGELRHAGGIKGPGSVPFLTEKLTALLAQAER